MPSQLPKFTFRVEAEVLEKLRYIAESNFRTVNKELEMIVNQHIDNYDSEHGAIPHSGDED